MLHRSNELDKKSVAVIIANKPQYIEYDDEYEPEIVELNLTNAEKHKILDNVKYGIPISRELEYKKQILKENKEKEQEYTKLIEINKSTGFIFPLPTMEHERECILIAARSGSGKTCWMRNYAVLYQKIHPKNKIFLISAKHEDKNLTNPRDEKGIIKEKLKLHKIEINEESIDLLDYPNNDIFSNSLIIMDDSIFNDKKIKIGLKNFQENILNLGRDRGTSLLVSKHVLNSGFETSNLKTECGATVVFPKFSDKNHIGNYLKALRVNENVIGQILHTKSRWVYIRTFAPLIVVEEHRAWFYN